MAKNISKLSAAMLPVAALTGCADKLPEKPNIVFLLFDDMGYGDLGCYGQELIETPHIDALAQQGIIFTDMYSSAPISAPSRCSIVTGQHAGHSQIRANEEAVPRGFDKGMPDWYFDRINADPEYEGQYPLAAGTETIGTMMQKAGYKTAMIGKWGLGGPTSEANPNKMGFDYFYGFNCQMLAHSYYPNYLWENGEKVMTGNEYMPVNRRLDPGADPYDVRSYDKFNQKYYAPDLMYERLENFVVENADNPFMVMWTTTVPHSTVQAPEDEVMYYVNKLGEEKTPITDGGWYYPVIYPKSSYAAMITHLDAQVGKLVQKLKDLGIYENTMFVGLEYFCNEGDELWCMNDEQFIAMAIDELVKIDIIDSDAVLDATRVKIKKAYPAYFGSYYELDKVKKFLDGIENLYCLGRNGQHRYNNMDHSMMTAMVAVENIKNDIKDKSAIWNVNTETEYHEKRN